jgi:peptide-methionine (S)-S-oxide reductase
LKGVEKVTPGYSGGKTDNPNYYSVSSGNTGHAEAIQIEFNPKIISFEKLLEVFFKLHDPTTINRQGNDVGEQYRSAVFSHNEKQKETAEKVIRLVTDGKFYEKPIVTEILPFEKFYPAENYHLDYYAKNPNQPYCRVVIDPKIQKLYNEFGNEVKS